MSKMIEHPRKHTLEKRVVFIVISHNPPCILIPIYKVVYLFGPPHFRDKKEKCIIANQTLSGEFRGSTALAATWFPFCKWKLGGRTPPKNYPSRNIRDKIRLIFHCQFGPAAGKSGPIRPDPKDPCCARWTRWSWFEVQLVQKYHIGLVLRYSRRVVFLRGTLYTTLYDRIGNIGVLRMGKDTKLSFPLAAAFRRLFVTKRPRGAFFAIVRFDERNCPVWGAWNRLRPFARLFLL